MPKLCHRQVCSFAYSHTATSPFFILFFFSNLRLGLKFVHVNFIGMVGAFCYTVSVDTNFEIYVKITIKVENLLIICKRSKKWCASGLEKV